MRTLEELRGSFASFFWAAKNSSSVVAGLARMAFSSARLAACFSTRRMRFLLRSMAEVFGMVGSGLGGGRLGSWSRDVLDAAERHTESLEQLAGLVVGLSRGHEGDVETHGALVVFNNDLGEDGEVGDANRVIALAIELVRHAAKIADGRERDREEAHEEVPHVLAAKRDVATGDLVGLQFEIGDGALRTVQHRLLAGDETHVARGVGDLVLVGLGTDAGVEDDLR